MADPPAQAVPSVVSLPWLLRSERLLSPQIPLLLSLVPAPSSPLHRAATAAGFADLTIQDLGTLVHVDTPLAGLSKQFSRTPHLSRVR